MARTTGRLTALAVQRARMKPGMYADGGGLYLQVTPNGASWIYRFMLNGRSREMGLGPLALFGLKEAREKALEARRLRHADVDPIEARKLERAAKRISESKAITFRQCADAYVKAHSAGWRNAKHARQWEATLATYADPIVGGLPVQAIDTALVMRVLEQEINNVLGGSVAALWRAKPETASRLRGRIESILDWAKVRGYRDGENPARWRGHLDKLLPARAKVRKIEHHAALPHDEVADFLRTLQLQDGVAARALEFAILAAARTGEVIGAVWGEMNVSARLWTVPAARMKAGKEHRVPLTARALTILAEMRPLDDARQVLDHDFVFRGSKPGRPLSNMAFLMLLRRMKREDLTVHGFRSSFRDWAAERTNFPSEVAEMALAHAISDKAEKAYRRGDLFDRRRRLMVAWEEFALARRPQTPDKLAHLHHNGL
jgi:integrase